MEQPQEVIEDEEHERAWDRVAAIDVAKASGVVCTGSRMRTARDGAGRGSGR